MPPSGSHSNRWLTLIAMTGSLSMIMLDQTVVSVALPSMTRDLPLSPTGQQWVVNAYVLALAALVAIGGKLGDRFGGVTTFRWGVTIFFVASVGCGLVPHGSWGQPAIIGFRALQGVGAALMMPVSAAIVMGAFPLAERGRAMAAYAGISQIFLAVGPLVGGLLTQLVSWRAVFWLNVPVGVAALILVRVAAPQNVRRADARVPLTSASLLVAGVGATVLAVQQASYWSWTSPTTLLTLLVGVALTTLFVVRQLGDSAPVVNVRLFARRGYLADVLVVGLTQFGLLAVVLFSSLYLQDLLHQGPIKAGLAVLPLVLPITAAAQIGGRWYDRSGVRAPVVTGLSLAFAGLIAWTISLPSLNYWLQTPGMVLTGLGLGLILSPSNTDALGRVEVSERSQASGLMQTVRQLGGTLGVALIGAIVLGIEHHGTSGGRQHAADAITAGFAAAAVSFLVALVVGYRLLSRDRLTEAPAREPAAALA